MKILEAIKNYLLPKVLPWVPLSMRSFKLSCKHSIGINDMIWNVEVTQPFEQDEDGGMRFKTTTCSSVCDACYKNKYEVISSKASGRTMGSMINY
jgi:hypothetical protein